jgi:signal transduction histidine kinase
MVYAPAFGTPFAVNTAREVLLLLVTAVTVIAFICFLLSLWLGLRMKQHYVNIFALLCAAMTGYTSYSITHTYIPVSGMLTYTLEIVSYYAMFLLVILLINRFCSLPLLWKRTSLAVSAVVCTLALILSAFSEFMTSDLRSLFSGIFTIYKWSVAVNLLASVIFAIYRKKRFSYPLLYCSVFFAISLVFDRIYPLYEPIYSGWFSEVSGAVFIMILGYIIWTDIMEAYSFSITFAEQKKQMERQLYMQKEHYDLLASKIAETKRLRHDMRQHFRVMKGFLSKGKLRELSDYINSIESTDYELSPVILCQNVLIDALLQYYRNISIKRGIDFDVQFSVPKSIPILDSDLSVMLGNLLENAFEACCSQTDNNIKPFISVHGSCNEKNLKFRITNTMDKNPRQNGEEFYSSKHEGFGIGLRSVRSVVEKHEGLIDIIFENKKFSVSVIIPFVF